MVLLCFGCELMVGRSDYVAHDGDKSRVGLHQSFMNQKTHLKKLGAKISSKTSQLFIGKLVKLVGGFNSF